MPAPIPWWKQFIAFAVLLVLFGLTLSGYFFNWGHRRVWSDVFGGAMVVSVVFFRLIHWTPRRRLRHPIDS